VSDIDRLVQIDKLAGLSQPVKELAEILLHQKSPKTKASRGCWRPLAKLLRPGLDGNPAPSEGTIQ
jgi:hypothetical protein